MRDLRAQLIRLGMDEGLATMAIPFVWFAPAVTDPYAPAIVTLVEAIQADLIRKGYAVKRTGYMDIASAQALTAAVGPRWEYRPWYVVIGDLLASRKLAPAAPRTAPSRLGMFDELLAGAKRMFTPSTTDFQVKDNLCMATTAAAKRQFEAFQVQLNRAQIALGLGPRVAVDGVIGPHTLAAVGRVAGSDARVSDMAGGDCAGLAMSAAKWTPALRAIGDRGAIRNGAEMTTILPAGARIAGIPMPLAAAAAAAVGLGAVWFLRRQSPRE